MTVKPLRIICHAFEGNERFAVFADATHKLWAHDPDFPGTLCPVVLRDTDSVEPHPKMRWLFSQTRAVEGIPANYQRQ